MPAPLLLGPIGLPELIIILLVVLVLFGGSRLAGLGKGVGRSIREFKEEVKTDTPIEGPKSDAPQAPTQPPASPVLEAEEPRRDVQP